METLSWRSPMAAAPRWLWRWPPPLSHLRAKRTRSGFTSAPTPGQEQGHLPLRAGPRRPASSRPGAGGGDDNPSFLAIHPTAQVPLRGRRDRRASNGKKTGARQRLRHRSGDRQADALNQQSSEGARAVPPGRRQGGQERRWSPTTAAAAPRRCPSTKDGKLGEAEPLVQHKGRASTKSPGSPARPLDQPRRRQQLRLRRRPRAGQGARLQVRRRQGHAHAQRPAAVGPRPRGRPAPLRLPPQRQVRLRHQRARLHRHRASTTTPSKGR